MEYSPPYKPTPPAGYVRQPRERDEATEFNILHYLAKPDGYIPVPNPLTETREIKSSPDAIDALSDLRLGFAYENKTLLKRLLDDRESLREREKSEIFDRISDLAGELGALDGLSYGGAGNRQRLDLEREKWQLEQELVNADLRSWRDRLAIQERFLQSERQYQKTKLQADLLEDLTG